MEKLPDEVLKRVNKGVREIDGDTKYGKITIEFNGEDSPVNVDITRKAHIHIIEQKRPVKQHYVRKG